jgi:hypothetical protein
MKLDTAQAEAVVRLENNPDFLMLLEAMNAYRLELLERVMFGSEDLVLTNRGMARSQTEVLRILGGARDQLRARKK